MSPKPIKLGGGDAAPAGLALPLPMARVLVVDDLPEICMLFRDLRRRIRGINVNLVTETNSNRAVALIAAQPFDLVISDFRMREVDGIEVLKAARADNPAGHRILMTGYNEVPASIDRIREAGVDAYVQKPLEIQELLLLLISFLRNDAETIESVRADARHLEKLALAEETTGRALA